MSAYRGVVAQVKYWVVIQLSPEKVVAHERSTASIGIGSERTTGNTIRSIEGSLEHVRRTICTMAHFDFLQCRPNPEKIVEVWY